MTRRSLLVDLDLPEMDDARPRADLEVARHPGDLDAHERRLAEASTPEGVYGALVDLFIGSAPADQAVRVTALAAHGDQLTAEQHDALRTAAARGLDPASPVPSARRSLLTSGATSPAPLVITTARTAVVPPVAPAVAAADATTAAVAESAPNPVPAPSPVPAASSTPSPSAPEPEPARPAAPESPRRTARVLVAAGIVVVLLVAAGLVLRSRGESTTAAVTGPSVTVTSASVPTPSTTPAPTTAVPTTAAPTTVAPTTASPTTPAPATVGPGPAATAGVAALFSALARPSAAWPSDAFTGDSATWQFVAGIGMSLTPSASQMALMTAAGAPMVPASPQPLAPSGLWVQGVPGTVRTAKSGRSSARGIA